DLKGRFTAVERVDEIRRPHPTVHAADKNPLLRGGEKRRVKSRRNTVIENKFGGKFGGRWLAAAGGFGLRENPACDRVRQLPFHRPKREPDAIPPQIAQAAGRLKPSVHANVAARKIAGAQETKRRRNPPHRADAPAIVEHFANARHTRIMHEHHAVHELHAVFAAGVHHFLNVGETDAARLFTNDVLARRRRAQNPFLAQAGRKRDVHGVHVRRCEQFLVTAERSRFGSERKLTLAFANEFAAAPRVTTGNGGDDGLAGI